MTTSRRAGRLGFVGVAYAFLVVMLGATLPTPLYPLYERELGFGTPTVTVVFAAYAVGVVAALLLLGRVSDVWGRRRLVLGAIALSALSSLVFVTSPGLGWLYAGRVLSGLSAGIATTTGTVYLVELAAPGRERRAALVATVVNMLGLGLGPPFAGILSELLPHPLVVPYAAHLALLVVAVPAVLAAREVVTDPGGSARPAWPSVAPQARAVFVPAAIAGFAAFATMGLVTGVTSGILSQVLGRTDRALIGVVVLTLFLASALGQVGLRAVPTALALRLGCAVLGLGAALLAGAVASESLPLLVLALAVAGTGQALCFRAGIGEISAQSPPALRARTVTTFFLVAYVGISFPVVLVGVASRPLGLRVATEVFSAAILTLALLALLLQLLLARRTSPQRLNRP